MMLLIASVAAVACGMALGLVFKVFILFLVSAVIVGAGGAHVAVYSDFSLLVPVAAVIVCVQVGYFISGIIENIVRGANPSGPGPAARSR